MAKKIEAKTILVIEDEADVRGFAFRVLELEGYQVLQAGDGEEGLRLLRENPTINLVLLDLRLPLMDGWTVLRRMRSEPEFSSIPVVVFSASAGLEKQRQALSRGVADYLVKPLSAATLKQTIARVFQREAEG